MIYVVFLVLATVVLELFLAKYPIGGLIIPIASMFGVIVAGMMLFAPSGDGWQDIKNRQALLLFLIQTATTFLIYYRKRRKEHQEGYLNSERAEKE